MRSARVMWVRATMVFLTIAASEAGLLGCAAEAMPGGTQPEGSGGKAATDMRLDSYPADSQRAPALAELPADHGESIRVAYAFDGRRLTVRPDDPWSGPVAELSFELEPRESGGGTQAELRSHWLRALWTFWRGEVAHTAEFGWDLVTAADSSFENLSRSATVVDLSDQERGEESAGVPLREPTDGDVVLVPHPQNRANYDALSEEEQALGQQLFRSLSDQSAKGAITAAASAECVAWTALASLVACVVSGGPLVPLDPVAGLVVCMVAAGLVFSYGYWAICYEPAAGMRSTAGWEP